MVLSPYKRHCFWAHWRFCFRSEIQLRSLLRETDFRSILVCMGLLEGRQCLLFMGPSKARHGLFFLYACTGYPIHRLWSCDDNATAKYIEVAWLASVSFLYSISQFSIFCHPL